MLIRVPDWGLSQVPDVIVSPSRRAGRWSMGSVIVGGARTPIGKLLGGLKDVSATDLGGHAIAAALRAFGRFSGAHRLRGDGSGPASRHRSDLRLGRRR